MAKLDKTQIRKGDRAELLLKKFFHFPGYMNRFLVIPGAGVKGGQFDAEALVFTEGNEEIIAFETDQQSDYKEAYARLENVLNGKGSLKFTGKYVDDGTIETVKLNDLEKTEEFGGQTGKRVNLGIKFEKDFYESLDCYLNCQCKPTPYEKEAKELLEKIGIPGGLIDVEAVGGKNQPRPIAGNSNRLYVTAGGKDTLDIGSIITDITTGWRNNEKVYLSLKHGNTLTFINSGVGKIFQPNDYQNFFTKQKGYSGYTNVIGKGIFKMFGIDPVEFASVFQNYGKGYKGSKVNTTSEADIGMIKTMLQYAIGYNYWMIHGGIGQVKMYKVDKEYMNRSSAITGDVTVHYGGSSGKGKRIDIHMESSVYKFMWNIRNKQGGLYPTHIMCDYKKK